MPLSDRQIKNAKPAEKAYKVSDGHGLYLLVKPNGGKYWRFKYYIDNKEKLLSIGTYPTISLAEAREAAENARRMVANGQSPSEAKQQAKREKEAALLNTFAYTAREWHAKQLPRWKPKHAARVLHYFETDVFPLIGEEPISGLRVKNIQAVLDKVANRGAIETAEKIRQWISSIFNYAAMLERADGNPAAPLVGYLQIPQTTNMPALPREELPEFYRRLLLADVTQQNRLCLLLTVLCFARNTEIRGGEWAEIDWQAQTWTIPAQRMKRPRAHLIPLADWPLELLHELHGLTGQGRFMFPSRTATAGYISENTMGGILNRIGYKGIATPHGFRSLASSVLNEQGFNADAIERQLAHVEDNKIRAAYNRAEYLAERAQMMQWYSDFLRQRYDAAKAML